MNFKACIYNFEFPILTRRISIPFLLPNFVLAVSTCGEACQDEKNDLGN